MAEEVGMCGPSALLWWIYCSNSTSLGKFLHLPATVNHLKSLTQSGEGEGYLFLFSLAEAVISSPWRALLVSSLPLRQRPKGSLTLPKKGLFTQVPDVSHTHLLCSRFFEDLKTMILPIDWRLTSPMILFRACIWEGGGKKGSAVQGCASNKINK